MIKRDKYTAKITLIIFLSTVSLYSQKTINPGISFGGVFPLGEVHQTHQYGIKFGFIEVFYINPPIFSVAAGQDFSFISSTDENFFSQSSSFKTDDINYFSFYVGPRFGNRYGPFLLTSIIISFYSTDPWVGADAGLGWSFRSSGFTHTIDITAKVRWLNTIKHEERETNLVVSELNFNFCF